MMPLALANIGEENMILKVGGDAETKRHLEDLGFVAGGPVTLVSSLGGNVIVTFTVSPMEAPSVSVVITPPSVCCKVIV